MLFDEPQADWATGAETGAEDGHDSTDDQASSGTDGQAWLLPLLSAVAAIVLSAGLSRLRIDSGRLARDGISYEVDECAAGTPQASLETGLWTVLRTILL